MLTFAQPLHSRFRFLVASVLIAATTNGSGNTLTTVQLQDTVSTWNEALVRHAVSAGDVRFDSGATAYLLAVMHGAMRDAIVVRHRQPGDTVEESFRSAAGAAAAHATLTTLLPEQCGLWDRLLADALRSLPDETSAATAVSLGRQASASWLDRHGYTAAAAAGSLGCSAPLPEWVRSAHPFALKRRDQIRAASPNLNRVLHRHVLPLPRSRPPAHDRPTSDETALVDRQFQATSPEEVWNHAMRHWAAHQPADLCQRARWFAVLNAALADAYLAAYESREHFRNGSWFLVFGRAAHAIAGNDCIDELHVEATVDNYPNVSAVVSGTAEVILQSICGSDEQTLATPPSENSVSPSRTYNRISAATRACALANAPTCGDVFESCDAGYTQGRKLGRWIAQRVR